MTDFRAYDTFEEMQADMARAEEEANKRIHPVQAAINPGDHVIRLVDMHGLAVLIVGKTYSVDEWVALEREAFNRYPDEDGFNEDWERRRYQERIDRGYLSGKWYSVMETEGEFGDTHRSQLGGFLPEPLFDAILALIQNRA